jgi:predicted SAM-dependent methyltransferase
MKGLNLGCGTRFHPEWTNLDANYEGPHVRVHNVCKGLPFPDETFDAVYHSHLLEHLPRKAVFPFTQECHRVLKGGGIIRVAVPDLERIARLYLASLEKVLLGYPHSDYDYIWAMLELYDQTVRDEPGGAMLEYLKQEPIPNEALVYERLGDEAREIVARLRGDGTGKQRDPIRHRWLNRVYRVQDRLRAALVRCLLGRRDYEALMLGRFRLSGEIHHWMYDRYSLSLLLDQSGFETPVERTGLDSAIDNWAQYNLDGDRDGTVYKPDSLYIEAIKPRCEKANRGCGS